MDDIKDNGIFEFMTPERAIELYQRIHSSGIPDLEWKFYGRKQLDEPRGDENNPTNTDDSNKSQEQVADATANTIQTEFDFDIDSFAESNPDNSSIINDSLQLSTRVEPASERKTNLSDIMSDLIKEKNAAETETTLLESLKEE